MSYDEGLLAEIAEETDPEKKILLELKQNWQHNEKKYSTAMKEISNLHAEISRLQTRNAKVGDPAIEKVSDHVVYFLFFFNYYSKYFNSAWNSYKVI